MRRRVVLSAAGVVALVAVVIGAPAPALADGGGTLLVHPSGPRPSMVEVWQHGVLYSDMHYRTDQDGSNFHFELDDVPAGSYQLYADSGGDTGARGWYVSTSRMSPTPASAGSVAVGDGGTTSVAWAISTGATFTGKLTDAAGKPISGLCFDLTNPSDGGDAGGGQSSAAGVVAMTNTLPGAYYVAYYDCSVTDSFPAAPWGYPLTYWNGTRSGAATERGAKPFRLGSGSAANVTIAANGLLTGSAVHPSDTSFEQVEAFAGTAVESGATASAVGAVTGSTYSLVVPAGTYHVAFYCQGVKPTATCSNGLYNWYGGGGFMAKAKAVRVAPGRASSVNEGALPTVVAENYAHLRRKASELVSVYCIFTRSACQGSETLALTVPALAKGKRTKNYKYSKGFSVRSHSTSLLSYALPATATAALAHHKSLTATLTLSVRGQAAITQRFTIR